MQYTLPDNPDVIAINVRYKDAYGNEILKTGSSATNQLILTGFNESVSDIPAQVTFQSRNGQESQPFDTQFSTEDSAPICFINGATVESGWNGCSLSFNNPEGTTGMAHVFYLGTNPVNNQPDTVLIESFPLTEGEDVKHYSPKQKKASHTIIVRVEDYRGYIVKERVWENIMAFNTDRLNAEDFEIIYNNSLEVPKEKIGLQYLTDGDVNGATWFEEKNKFFYYTFISKENGVGEDSEPMYIDLKKLRPTSELRFYAMRNLGSNNPYITPNKPEYVGPQYFKQYFSNKLPSSITIYGCRENTDSHDWNSMEWEEVASFEQNPDADNSDRWTYHAATCGGTSGKNSCTTLSKLEAVDPIYLTIPIDITLQGEGFRYFKIKFNSTFNLGADYEYTSTTNKTTKYLTFHELEIYAEGAE